MIIGKHSDLLFWEDSESQNVAANEPWWEPRHRADGEAQFPETE